MTLNIIEQFCNQFECTEDLEYVKDLYKNYNIKFLEGYKKLCVQEQLINLDEIRLKCLFNIWPELELSYTKSNNPLFILDVKLKDE